MVLWKTQYTIGIYYDRQHEVLIIGFKFLCVFAITVEGKTLHAWGIINGTTTST